MSLSDFESQFFEHHQAGDDGDITVVRILMSHMTEEDNIIVFGDHLQSLPNQYGCQKIVLDCQLVQYVTSSVLGKLITLHRSLHRSSGNFVLCNVSESFAEVLQTSRLHTYFTITESVDEALQRISQSPDSDQAAS